MLARTTGLKPALYCVITLAINARLNCEVPARATPCRRFYLHACGLSRRRSRVRPYSALVGGGGGGRVGGGGGGGGGGCGGSDGATPLLDCVVLKPGSTVGDLVEVCKRASPPLLSGDFVRADARAARPTDEQLAKGLPVRKDSIVTAATAIVRLQTSRRSQWQK